MRPPMQRFSYSKGAPIQSEVRSTFRLPPTGVAVVEAKAF
jgi:hypothetical protein